MLIMHAFLFIGVETSSLMSQISDLGGKLHAEVMEFPLKKIEDVRNLNNLVRLSFKEPTLIVCKDIHEAGEEALNAFLKNLEEPQQNIYFALTTTSARKVLPTITSRCQVVKIANSKLQITNNEEMETFFALSTGKRLSYVDKIKDRQLAVKFAENMVNFMHMRLHKSRSTGKKDVKYSVDLKEIKAGIKTLSRLKANGNVNLQLSNFVINNGK